MITVMIRVEEIVLVTCGGVKLLINMILVKTNHAVDLDKPRQLILNGVF